MNIIKVTGVAKVSFVKTIRGVSDEEAADIRKMDQFEFADCNVEESDITGIMDIDDVDVTVNRT